MSDLVFNEAQHKYYQNGVELISVTTLLKSVGIIDDRFYKPSGTQRGTLVHKQTEEIDKGIFDWEKAEHLPYLKAWVTWKKDLEFVGIEEIMGHPMLGYAGTIDRITSTHIIDIKTGAKARWHQLQLTLYGMMYEANTGKHLDLACVYLTKEGKHRFVEYEWDLKTAMAIVRVNQWKKSK